MDSGEQKEFDFTYSCNPLEVKGQINLNFDIDGRLIGIEVLQASKKQAVLRQLSDCTVTVIP